MSVSSPESSWPERLPGGVSAPSDSPAGVADGPVVAGDALGAGVAGAARDPGVTCRTGRAVRARPAGLIPLDQPLAALAGLAGIYEPNAPVLRDAGPVDVRLARADCARSNPGEHEQSDGEAAAEQKTTIEDLSHDYLSGIPHARVIGSATPVAIPVSASFVTINVSFRTID